jgi:hypothetical protein
VQNLTAQRPITKHRQENGKSKKVSENNVLIKIKIIKYANINKITLEC